ncbi:MAG: hypothetical protein AB1714_00830 [Acidobacteriota bacterium]
MLAKSRLLLAYLTVGWLLSDPCFCEEACVELRNNSVATLCAEEDNVNMALRGVSSRFVIEATHPAYAVTTYDCPPNSTNCPPPSGDSYNFTPAQLKLHDDGTWVVWAYRESSFWRPQGMTASSVGGPSLEDTHYLAVSKKLSGEDSWPQFLVLYADGNLRLIPHPPTSHLQVAEWPMHDRRGKENTMPEEKPDKDKPDKADRERECVKETYDHERDRGESHGDAIEHAKEVCKDPKK